MRDNNNKQCQEKMEVYSRIVGYYRPTKNWNKGKREEFKNRETFNIEKSLETIEKIEEEKSIFTID